MSTSDGRNHERSHEHDERRDQNAEADDYRDDYRKEWVDTPSDVDGMDEEGLLGRVKEQAQAFERRIRRRDLREIGAGVFVVLAFGYETVTAETWLARTGAAVVMCAALYIIWKLRRARPEDDAQAAGRAVSERLRQQLRAVDRQIRLHETALRWYLAPLILGSLMFVAGLGAAWWATLITVAVIALISVRVRRANRSFVQEYLKPRRRRLAEVVAELAEG